MPPRTPDEDADDYPCPLCLPWTHGFAGFMVEGQWVIPPYGSGEEPAWNGYPGRAPAPSLPTPPVVTHSDEPTRRSA